MVSYIYVCLIMNNRTIGKLSENTLLHTQVTKWICNIYIISHITL